jgi:hypothetical protein
MYNLRYHIASLVAVFLALSVGLLMGTVVVERGLLDSQKTTLVTGLQKQYDTLRTTSQELRTRADTLDAFAADAEPGVMGGVLAGRMVAVLADPGAGEAVTSASDAVRRAGGSPAVLTFTQPGLGLSDAAVVSAAAAAMSVPEASVDETSAIPVLVREWTVAGEPRLLTDALIKVGVLRADGLAPGAVVSGSVACAAWDDAPDAAALRLATALTGPGRFAVAAGTVKRPAGLAAAALEAGISGIETVDTALGRVSLVWVLAGRASGRYGTSKDADAPYPAPLFPGK